MESKQQEISRARMQELMARVVDIDLELKSPDLTDEQREALKKEHETAIEELENLEN